MGFFSFGLGFTLAFGFSSLALGQSVLSVDNYLEQVKKRNLGYSATKETVSAATDKHDEGELLLSPRLMANAQQVVDDKEQPSPALQGDKTTARSASLGVSKLTSFGLQAKVAYNVDYTKIEGLSSPIPGSPSTSEAYTAYPSIELSQSLWRNFFGSETRALVEMGNAQANVSQYGEKYKGKIILLEAEMAYWRFALAREMINVQKQRLARSSKLRDWNAGRAKSGLADRADLLQSEAAVKVSQLELQAANDEEHSSARNFNRIRGIDSTDVSERIATIDDKLLETARIPKVSGPREDILAAKESERLIKASAKVSVEKLTPTFELFGMYAMNGREEKYSEAEQESFKNEHPTRVIGLRLNAPLNLMQVHRTKAAYMRDQSAAELNSKQRQFDVDREWNDLKQKFDEAKTRFKLVQAIENAQREKVDHERTRYNKGRSTTAQVLMFEQDYSLSQMNRIRAQGEVLGIATQLKVFASGI